MSSSDAVIPLPKPHFEAVYVMLAESIVFVLFMTGTALAFKGDDRYPPLYSAAVISFSASLLIFGTVCAWLWITKVLARPGLRGVCQACVMFCISLFLSFVLLLAILWTDASTDYLRFRLVFTSRYLQNESNSSMYVNTGKVISIFNLSFLLFATVTIFVALIQALRQFAKMDKDVSMYESMLGVIEPFAVLLSLTLYTESKAREQLMETQEDSSALSETDYNSLILGVVIIVVMHVVEIMLNRLWAHVVARLAKCCILFVFVAVHKFWLENQGVNIVLFSVYFLVIVLMALSNKRDAYSVYMSAPLATKSQRKSFFAHMQSTASFTNANPILNKSPTQPISCKIQKPHSLMLYARRKAMQTKKTM